MSDVYNFEDEIKFWRLLTTTQEWRNRILNNSGSSKAAYDINLLFRLKVTGMNHLVVENITQTGCWHPIT